MNQTIRVGIVGCGSVMSPYAAHVEKLGRRGEVKVVAACDIQPERREFVADEFGIHNFTTDYRELVWSKDVDLVLVLTSMPMHGPVTLEALRAGKHVLVEKPMAVTLEEAAEIVRLARESPGYLLCGPHVILAPTYQAIWQHVHRGDIGSVFLARARYGWAGPWWGPWFYRSGGGPYFDLAVYGVTSLTGLLGPAKRVMGMAGIAIPERVVDGEPMRVEVEDNAQFLVDFGENVFASFTTGFTMQQCRTPAYELYGSEGTIQLLGDDWDPQGYELWENRVGAWKVFPEIAPNWPWTDGLRHLVECIQQNVPPIITPEHAYHVLEILIRAHESGIDGQAKTIESTFSPLSLSGDEAWKPPHLIHDRTREE